MTFTFKLYVIMVDEGINARDCHSACRNKSWDLNPRRADPLPVFCLLSSSVKPLLISILLCTFFSPHWFKATLLALC